MSTTDLAFLASLTRRLATDPPLQQVLGPILRGLSERMGLRRATLMLRDPLTGDLHLEAAHGLTPSEVRGIRYAPGEGINGEALATGRTIVVPDVTADPRYADKLGAKGEGEQGAFYAVPLLVGPRVLGTLAAWQTAPTTDRLDHDPALLEVVARLLVPAVERHVEQTEAPPADEDVRQPPNLLGRSKRMREVYALLQQVAPSPTTVLLRGESGTGKELVARALHEGSPRRRGPFVKVNCAALPTTLIESELFGHERGAFTGALQRRQGRFELAHGGTLFLDESGDLAPETQVKLLRVLQERVIERVGSAEPLPVDVRVIAATNVDLDEQMARGTFREDLFYRLNVFPIRLPALRERRADILLLSDHFVERYAKAHGSQVRRLATSAIDLLLAYHWPGNVRELENCIERAVLVAPGEVIMAHHLPPSLQGPEHDRGPHDGGLQATLDAIERDLLLDTLKATRGNRAAAARRLQLTERVMGLRIQKHGIEPKRFR